MPTLTFAQLVAALNATEAAPRCKGRTQALAILSAAALAAIHLAS